jgi:hypothetical protein
MFNCRVVPPGTEWIGAQNAHQSQPERPDVAVTNPPKLLVRWRPFPPREELVKTLAVGYV